MGENYDKQGPHRHFTGDNANRTNRTPLHGELMIVTDTPSPKVYSNGDTPIAGGYLVGPMGAFFGVEKVSTDLIFNTIPWGGTAEKTEDFTHDIATNADEVTVVDSGGYSATVNLTVYFTVTCYLEVWVQRYNGSSWGAINGAKGRLDGTAGNYGTMTVNLTQPMVAGWKFRVLAVNSNFIAAQVACLADFCSFSITRYR